MEEAEVDIVEAVQVVIVGAVIDLEVVQTEAVPVVIEAVVINQVVVIPILHILMMICCVGLTI